MTPEAQLSLIAVFGVLANAVLLWVKDMVDARRTAREAARLGHKVDRVAAVTEGQNVVLAEQTAMLSDVKDKTAESVRIAERIAEESSTR